MLARGVMTRRRVRVPDPPGLVLNALRTQFHNILNLALGIESFLNCAKLWTGSSKLFI